MKWFIALVVLYGGAQIEAQQYATGPVPQRPAFAGAALVQAPRSQAPPQRIRGGAPRGLPENAGITYISANAGLAEAPQVRLRRPQPQGRVRGPFVPPQAQPALEQTRSNFIDDERNSFSKTRLSGPTPLPQVVLTPQQPLTTKLLTPRPVIEVEEDDESVSTVTTPGTTALPASIRAGPQPSPIPSGFQRPQFLQPTGFRPAAQSPLIQPIAFPESATLQARQLQPRPPIRPIQPVTPRPAPVPTQYEDDDEEEDEPQYYRQQQKKAPEPVRQQSLEQEQYRPPARQQQVIRQQPIRQQNEYSRPVQSVPKDPHVKASGVQQRGKKPVVQTIKKYHEENEDGSITWGYENDDGSFKEETIGVDCVTRGKYGYYDPDGVKREYTYQTGIPCDREQEEAEAAASVQDGFIDYTNNKYVLPNGEEIDLESMVKNRARKPVYRN